MSELARIILDGGVVVFPTDTVYGIGCNPYDDRAVARVFSIKARDAVKALPVLANGLATAERLVSLPEQARKLVSRYWPGPLTVIAPLKDAGISKLVTAGSSKLAVRVPANKCLLSLLDKVTCLVGTSANISGERPSADAPSVTQSGISGFDALLIDSVPAMGTESTIVDFTANGLRVIREGAVSAIELRSHLTDLL